MGALTSLETLALALNKIGDVGLSALSEALSKGALPSLEMLALGSKQIGDAGITAFSSALGSGALPKLNLLFINPPSAELKALCSSTRASGSTSRNPISVDTKAVCAVPRTVLGVRLRALFSCSGPPLIRGFYRPGPHSVFFIY